MSNKTSSEHMEYLITLAEEQSVKQGLDGIQGSVLVEVTHGKPSATTLVRLDHAEGEEGDNSIIPLQEEFYFHLALATRVYEQIVRDLFPASNQALYPKAKLEQLTKEAHTSTMHQVMEHIHKAYQDARAAATKDGVLDVSIMNKHLDKARAKITPLAHTQLMQNIVEKTGIVFKPEHFKRAKKIAESTTATDDDILYVNKQQGLVTLIKGSKITAHHRVKGSDFGHRQLITHQIDAEGHVSELAYPRIQIRTPSPVVKKGLKEPAIIKDVVTKIKTVVEAYGLEQTLIYNRYTAINDTLGDTGGNLQTQSAAHILQAAHQYNHEVALAGDDAYFLVENISVNGFGDTLGYEKQDPLLIESTLMAEMALVHTLTGHKGMMGLYKAYLMTENRPKYFSESEQGKSVIKVIQNLKSKWQKETPDVSQEEDDVTLAKGCLKKLMAQNAHFTHEYAKLIQALSVYVEPVSLGGCKSGNERAQAINGRVLILDAMKPGSPMHTQLKALASAQDYHVMGAAEALKQIIDNTYNDQALYGAASVVSLVDQGAPAKVEAKPKGMHISRNYAEESASTMTNLRQEKAGQMQAHKGLTKHMKGAWLGHPDSLWRYMSSGPMGVFGAVFATVTVVPAIVLAIKHAFENDKKAQVVTEHNQIIKACAALEPDTQVRMHKWIDKIGDYELSDDQSLSHHLSQKAINALYRGTHKKDEPKTAREALLRFLTVKYLKEQPFDRDDSRGFNTITMKDLLGKEGLKLYKLATVEEGKSKSFREAVFLRSLKHLPGQHWKKKLLLWVGGPSSSGKTFASESVLEHLSQHETQPLGAIKGDNTGNDVAFVDGSYEREMSQMRQMVLQFALSLGYKGISDLHKNSRALTVKGDVRNAALESDGVSIVIPDTFVRDPINVNKEFLHFEKLAKTGDYLHAFSEVKERPEHRQDFKTAVKNMGASRAWSSEPFYEDSITMNNKDIGCESKAYQAKYFMLGLDATKLFKKHFKEDSQDKITLKIINDLVYLKHMPDGTWTPCEFKDDLTELEEGKDYIRMPARVYEAWLRRENKAQNLPEYYQVHKKDPELTKPMIEFKDNKFNSKYENIRRAGFFSLHTGQDDDPKAPKPAPKEDLMK